MPDYIAFLRAINLGATRRFPQADVLAATEAAGMSDIQVYLNTGNVRLTSRRRSAAAVRRDLERAYEQDRGFAVATVVFRPEEIRTITERGRQLRPENVDGARHYIQLLHEPPPPAAVTAMHARSAPGEQVLVEGRAAYALIGSVHDSVLLRTREYASLGEGTSRTISVLTTITAKWC